MSFIERNKAWVLPLLGVAAVGVIYMNVKMMGPAAKSAAAPAKPAPVAGAPTAAPVAASTPVTAPPPPPPAPPPSPAHTGAPDLWADLRVLEEPWAGLNQSDGLLRQGSQALRPEALRPSPRPALPSVSVRVPEPPPQRMSLPSEGPLSPPQPVPEVDFLMRNARGSAAWVGGSGFREGQLLSGGWRVRRITPDMVEVEGHGGVVRRWTNPMKARTTVIAPTPEAP